MNARVLVGTDDVDYFLFLEHILANDGFDTYLADGLDEILQQAVEWKPQAVMLDCRPGSFSATQACSELRREPVTQHLPVFAVIAPGAEQEHVHLLRMGIDDTFTRPVPPAQLVQHLHARIGVPAVSAALPAAGSQPPSGDATLVYADIEMDVTSYRVERNGREINLGRKEFNLLRHLMENPEKVFSREELIGAAWQSHDRVAERTVDVHMGRLRKSLSCEIEGSVIRTVRSKGYALSV